MPPSSCSRNSASCCPKYTANSATVIPSTPGAPRLAFTRCNAFLRLPASHTSSIRRSVAGFSVTPFTIRDSVPCPWPVRASPSPAQRKVDGNGLRDSHARSSRTSRLESDSCTLARAFAPRFLQTQPRGWSRPCVLLPFTSIRLVGDFHPQAVKHAQHRWDRRPCLSTKREHL